MYPMCGLDSMLQHTNQNAVANGISQCVSKGEFLKFFGLRLAIWLVNLGEVHFLFTGKLVLKLALYTQVQTLVVASKCPGTDFKIY